MAPPSPLSESPDSFRLRFDLRLRALHRPVWIFNHRVLDRLQGQSLNGASFTWVEELHGRDGRQNRQRCFQWCSHPRVLVERSPTHKYQTTTGFQRPTDVSKCDHGITEKHHAKAGESCVLNPTCGNKDQRPRATRSISACTICSTKRGRFSSSHDFSIGRSVSRTTSSSVGSCFFTVSVSAGVP